MTKITTDFVGSETIAVTKQRLTDILAYWGASTAAYTTWGQARTALNALLTSTTAGTIGSTELAGSFLPKINFLNDPDEMIADALFGAGEQGVWLDPSDVANVAWRRNLLLWTEQFDVITAWNRTGIAAITANDTTAPDGTLTAEKLVPSATSGEHKIAQITSSVAGNNVVSVYAKDAGAGWLLLQGAGFAWFNLATGATGTQTSCTATIQSVGSGWYRCSISIPAATPGVTIWATNGNGVTSYTGDGTSGVYIWGAQLETGTVATEYQRITDLNAEVIERFPNATMYQDAAGTTPVTAPGQPVGLRLDKSKALGLSSTDALAGNGNFSNPSYWTDVSGVSTISGGQLTFNGSATTGGQFVAAPIFPLVIGKYYQVTFDVVSIASGGIRIWLGTGTPTYTATTAGTHTFRAACVGDNAVRLYNNGTATTAVVDNVVIRELAGNHATQSVAGSRPMYGIEPKGGRRNLLTWSEDFRDTAAAGETRPWTYVGATVAAVSTTAPNGATTADLLTENTAGGAHDVEATPAATATTAYTVSTYFKRAIGVRDAYIQVNDNASGANGAVAAIFDLSTGASSVSVLVPGFTSVTAIAVPVGTTGWYRCSMSLTTIAGTTSLRIFQGIYNASRVYTGNGTSGIYVWGAQLEKSATATNYQRVTSDFDVTEAGVNTCHYCQYDGINDGMVTNSIDFTATDKMSVFAGVWKRSDAAVGVIAELSISAGGLTNGTFVLHTQPSPAGYLFGAGSGPSNSAFSLNSVSAFAAPVSSVITALSNFAGATLSDENKVRVNGVTPTEVLSGFVSSGNYGATPLYIGRRGGSSLPFNGRDYGIIVTGKLANATAIATTEMWLANKTSGVTL